MRLLSFAVVAVAACSGPSGSEPDARVVDDAANDATSDAAIDAVIDAACTITATTEVCDGTLDENCDGTVDEGCTDDPFVAANCGGTPWTHDEALARLGALPREMLASATIQVRTRSCVGMTCDPWGAGAPWQTQFLTYSGGVTTRYINLQADTHLVLYAAAGVAKLSLQHVTFAAGNYTDSQGIVFAIPPAPLSYPRFRAYNVAPANPYDYVDLETAVKNGVLQLGARCARFTANVYGATEPYTTEYAALYRW